MAKRLYTVFIAIVLTFVFCKTSYSFVPEDDCPKKGSGEIDYKFAEDKAEIEDAISNASLVNDQYVVCFSMSKQIKLNNTLEIKGKDKNLIIYGLSIKNDFDFYGAIIPDILVSISGSDISLINATFNKQLEATTTALRITGSNVKIVDSIINASEKGIVIDGGEDIQIVGTAITGPGKDIGSSVAVDIGDARNALVADSSLKNFESGINYISSDNLNTISTTKTAFENIKLPIKYTSGYENSITPIFEKSKIGKTLDETGERVKRVAGKSPVNYIGAQEAYKGYVDFYTKPGWDIDEKIKITYYSMLPLFIIDNESDEFGIYTGSGEKPEDKTGCQAMPEACTWFSVGDCVFDSQRSEIADFGVDPLYSALFSYVDKNLNPHELFDINLPQAFTDMGDIIASIPVAATPGPVTSGLQEGPESSGFIEDPATVPEDDSGSGGSAGGEMAAGGDSGGEGGITPGGFGMMKKMGCSLFEGSDGGGSVPIAFLFLVIPIVLAGLLRRSRLPRAMSRGSSQ